MLSAVTSFIIDSLSMVGEEGVEEGDLSIEIGGFSVILATSDTFNLVAITKSATKEEVKEQLEIGVDVLEDKFGDILVDWDGDMEKIEGVKPYVKSLVKGEFATLMKKKELASSQILDSISLMQGSGLTDPKRELLGQGTVEVKQNQDKLDENEEKSSN